MYIEYFSGLSFSPRVHWFLGLKVHYWVNQIHFSIQFIFYYVFETQKFKILYSSNFRRRQRNIVVHLKIYKGTDHLHPKRSYSVFTIWNVQFILKDLPLLQIWTFHFFISAQTVQFKLFCDDSDVGDLKLVTLKCGCWWLNFDAGDIFWILVPDANVKR